MKLRFLLVFGLFICTLNYIHAQQNICDTIYVWDIQAEKPELYNLADLLTDEIEKKLVNCSKCLVLERRSYTQVLAHCLEEYSQAECLKTIKSKIAVFGELSLQGDRPLLRISFNHLLSTQILGEGSLLLEADDPLHLLQLQGKVKKLIDDIICKDDKNCCYKGCGSLPSKHKFLYLLNYKPFYGTCEVKSRYQIPGGGYTGKRNDHIDYYHLGTRLEIIEKTYSAEEHIYYYVVKPLDQFSGKEKIWISEQSIVFKDPRIYFSDPSNQSKGYLLCNKSPQFASRYKDSHHGGALDAIVFEDGSTVSLQNCKGLDINGPEVTVHFHDGSSLQNRVASHAHVWWILPHSMKDLNTIEPIQLIRYQTPKP